MVVPVGRGRASVEVGRRLGRWPVLRQLRAGDWFGLGETARSPRSEGLEPRIAAADREVRSICPYCAVGCGQKVYVKDEWLERLRVRDGLLEIRAGGAVLPVELWPELVGAVRQELAGSVAGLPSKAQP